MPSENGNSVAKNAGATGFVMVLVMFLGWGALLLHNLGSDMNLVKERLANNKDTFSDRLDSIKAEAARQEVYMNQIWSRLRAGGENIKLLADEIEDYHPEAEIEIVQPEQF